MDSASNTGLITRVLSLVFTTGLLSAMANPLMASEFILFQPGQSSWEWLLVPSSHEGGKRMREGKTCLHCHAGEEEAIGNLIASGQKLEPAPVAGLPGIQKVDVTASFDETNLYLTLKWVSPALPEPIGDEEADIHLTVMLGSPEFSLAAIAGCWAACHNDLPGMPDAQAGQDLTKYLPGSRTKMSKTGGGDDLRPEAELAAQISKGEYLEYWQAVLDQGQLVGSSDGYFLQGRIPNDETAVQVTASADGAAWTVDMVRPLDPGGDTRHALSPGVEYTLAIALHEHHASGRHHYTSFPLRFYLGPGEAELNASQR